MPSGVVRISEDSYLESVTCRCGLETALFRSASLSVEQQEKRPDVWNG